MQFDHHSVWEVGPEVLNVKCFCAASLIDGKPIVNLPPRIVKLQQSEFSMEERFFYSNLETESRAQFQVSNTSIIVS